MTLPATKHTRRPPREPGPGTRCVRAGTAPDALTGALVPHLVQSTTYAWKDLDSPPDISYARAGNPTVEALERRLAILEGGDVALAFGSGLAAIDALVRTLPAGARIVCGSNVYGGTVRLLQQIHTGRPVEWVDTSDLKAVRAALEKPADLVLVETPSNPTLAITDLAAVAKLVKGTGASFAVDNTFLTPLSQRPIELGADVVIHSTTKYLDGHNATLGGALVFAKDRSGGEAGPTGSWAERARWLRKSTGAVLAPFEAWLTLQGSKTLHLRTRQQWSSAARVAGAARRHQATRRVLYPGLESHPGHETHRRQALGDGGIVALDLGSREGARVFVSALQLFTLAENLGATESLVTHPLSMTHSDVPADIRTRLGITDGLVRLSLGVEDPEDLVADVVGALDVVAGQTVPAARAKVAAR